jgi:hypothetical protein
MPSFILIRANPHQDVTHSDEKYVLLMRTMDQFIVLNNPMSFMQTGVWNTTNTLSTPQIVKVLRNSSRHGGKEYECTITRTRDFVQVLRYGDIYVYTMTNANTVLSSKYYTVCAGRDMEKSFHFEKRDLELLTLPVTPSVAPPLAQPVAQLTKIPQHIFRCFVDSAIEKNDICPITMEPLARDTVASTPCGHLFNCEAIKMSLQVSKRCPTCRYETSTENLQTY